VDAGSTDDSVEIIRKYVPWLTYWVAEKDRGQSHAINKGWARSTGDIWAWLNADDLYLPGAIGRAVEALHQDPANAILYSDGLRIDETLLRQKLVKGGSLDARLLLMGSNGLHIPQPTVFMRQFAVRAVGGLDESLPMAMDFDLWVKLSLRYRLGYLEGPPLAILREHALQKTNTRQFEGLRCALVVLERGFQDSRCPACVNFRGNNSYSRICLELAFLYLRNYKDYRKFISYFLSAWESQPAKTMQRLANKGITGLYRQMMPESIKRLIRRLRGTENRGWLTTGTGL